MKSISMKMHSMQSEILIPSIIQYAIGFSVATFMLLLLFQSIQCNVNKLTMRNASSQNANGPKGTARLSDRMTRLGDWR